VPACEESAVAGRIGGLPVRLRTASFSTRLWADNSPLAMRRTTRQAGVGEPCAVGECPDERQSATTLRERAGQPGGELGLVKRTVGVADLNNALAVVDGDSEFDRGVVVSVQDSVRGRLGDQQSD
jgi:hypothetical protein